MARQRGNDIDTFFTHVDQGDTNECWLWHGARRGGYGSGWINGHKEGAHKVAYLLFVGVIPEGVEVMHKCDTPLCVNPNHLELGTHQKNMQDKVDRGRHNPLKGENTPHNKLTSAQVIEIWGLKR